MAEVVSARLTEELLARLDEVRGDASRGAWLTDLLTRELTATARPDAPAAVADAIPSPGVLCMWAHCQARDTSRYGVTDPAELARRNYRELPRDEDKAGHALCPAHAALLGGLIYRRPVPLGAARALGVPAA